MRIERCPGLPEEIIPPLRRGGKGGGAARGSQHGYGPPLPPLPKRGKSLAAPRLMLHRIGLMVVLLFPVGLTLTPCWRVGLTRFGQLMVVLLFLLGLTACEGVHLPLPNASPSADGSSAPEAPALEAPIGKPLYVMPSM